MTDFLVGASIALLKRERPSVVAASGLVFQALGKAIPPSPLRSLLESHRGGVWGEVVSPGMGFPVLRSTNTRGVRVETEQSAWCEIPAAMVDSCSLRTGDILVTKSSGSSDLVGKSALFVHPGDNRNYLFSNFMLRLRPESQKIHPEFLAWFLRSPQSLAWRFDAQQTTVGLRNLQTKSFLSQAVPVPPIRTQESLIDYLNAVERGNGAAASVDLGPLLVDQRRIVARVEELAAKVEEARGLRREADVELSALVMSLHSTLSGPEIRPLSEFLVLDEIREPVVPDKEYPQVGVLGYGKGLFAKAAIDSSQTTYKHFNRLYSGAIVLSQVKGWEGAIAVCRESLSGWYASPEYRTFRCIEGRAVPEYLAALVTTSWFHNQLKDATRGVGARRERTRPESFLRLLMCMPNIEDQRRAVDLLGRVPRVRQLHYDTLSELDALVPAILDKAFRGEL